MFSGSNQHLGKAVDCFQRVKGTNIFYSVGDLDQAPF